MIELGGESSDKHKSVSLNYNKAVQRIDFCDGTREGFNYFWSSLTTRYWLQFISKATKSFAKHESRIANE